MTTDTLLAATEPLDLAADLLRPRLGELLVQAGKLSARDLERALSAQQEMGSMLGRVMVRRARTMRSAPAPCASSHDRMLSFPAPDGPTTYTN